MIPLLHPSPQLGAPAGESQSIKRTSRGFTLVEILIVVAVFSLTMLVATNIFLLATRGSRRAALSQKIQGDMRFALEAIAREARYGTIDYECYEPNPTCDTENPNPIDLSLNNGKTDLLALRDVNGNRVRYRVRDDAAGVKKLYVCLIDITQQDITFCNDRDHWEAVTPDEVKIVKGEFYLYPFVNPFSLNPDRDDPVEPIFLADAQPRVTIVLKTQQVAAGGVPENISAQTTVVSRLYAR